MGQAQNSTISAKGYAKDPSIDFSSLNLLDCASEGMRTEEDSSSQLLFSPRLRINE